MKKPASNRGMALLTAIIIMVFLLAIVITLDSVGRMSMIKTMNHRAILNARLASESGLNFIKYHIRDCQMVNCDNGSDAITGLKQYFTSKGIAYTSTTTDVIEIADIPIPGMDGSFNATIGSVEALYPTETPPVPGTDPVIEMQIVGECQDTQRAVKIRFELALGSRSPIFDFGFSTGGVLKLNGNSSILGYNEPGEANVYMSNLATDKVIILLGNSALDGKVFACHEDAYVSAGSNCSVSGDFGADIIDNVYQGVDKYPLPTIDTTPFTDAVSSYTPVNSTTNTTDATMSNIRIAANTNPTFTGSTNLNGLIYIEAPNKVTFTGDINITGTIVTETGNDGNDCQINFAGGVNIQGPENLPDTPEFSTLRTLKGTAVLAEGFKVTFSGTNETIGGTMAASSFNFNGNGDLHVKGSVICYKDGEMTTLVGDQTIKIDQSEMPKTPPGFVGGGLTVLSPVAETYASTPEGHF